MIVVGGFNSAIDTLLTVDRLTVGAVVRVKEARPLPGGKGLHVAQACGTFGEPVTLVGITDRATRESFERALADVGGRFVGIEAGRPIRTCLAIRDDAGQTTELLEPGPELSDDAAAALCAAFEAEAAGATHASLSGSLPRGLGAETYARLIRRVGHGKVALDASGDAFARGIAEGPLLVKPNRQEAAQLLGTSLDTRGDAAAAAAAIAARGPRIVLLSLGSEGAILHVDGRTVAIAAPAVDAQNVVGAGDCSLGGFLVGLSRQWAIDDCARFAVACGTAKVMHAETGVVSPADVEQVARGVRTMEIGRPD